jgi:hypothetical protein
MDRTHPVESPSQQGALPADYCPSDKTVTLHVHTSFPTWFTGIDYKEDSFLSNPTGIFNLIDNLGSAKSLDSTVKQNPSIFSRETEWQSFEVIFQASVLLYKRGKCCSQITPET